MKKSIITLLSLILLLLNTTVAKAKANSISYINKSSLESEKVIIETDSGWGLTTSYTDDVDQLTCPKSYVDGNEIKDWHIEVKKGSDDDYVNQFRLRLNTYIDSTADLSDLVKNTAISTILETIFISNANCNIRYMAAQPLLNVLLSKCFDELNYTVEEMTETQDEMAFFYRELTKYDLDE